MSIEIIAEPDTPLMPVTIPLSELGARITEHLANNGRLGHLTARLTEPGKDTMALIAVMLAPQAPHVTVWQADIPCGTSSYPSITHYIPSAHWYERFIYDLFGLMPEGHPRFNSVIFHAGWPEDHFPLLTTEDKPPTGLEKRRDFHFLPVHGDGIFEIAVGPIHAGIIEPGHFRFSCLGEEIENLDIRLGYLHRGIEKRLEGSSLLKAGRLAEAASTDTTIGNALAHAIAVENMLNVAISNNALILRTIALEIERIACHIGDIGGVCGDIGFLGGAATFAKLRGKTLGIAERLAGSRFMTSFVLPGGVARGLSPLLREQIIKEVEELTALFESSTPIVIDNFGALDRMEGVGILRPGLARDLGVIGPAGRASGVQYDVREFLQQAPYRDFGWKPAYADESDAYARIKIRVMEVAESLNLIRRLIPEYDPASSPLPSNDLLLTKGLPTNSVGVGVVEAWRGELIHTIFTDTSGSISRYAIKDPSTNNWPGLAHAVRGATISDFPLCNKSFSLSYSGNDL
jgi:Ni,Fe-hydrogenase III large subunit/Ni,Fe-hydrogenase III component G